jgi:hypothetical protein
MKELKKILMEPILYTARGEGQLPSKSSPFSINCKPI